MMTSIHPAVLGIRLAVEQLSNEPLQLSLSICRKHGALLLLQAICSRASSEISRALGGSLAHTAGVVYLQAMTGGVTSPIQTSVR